MTEFSKSEMTEEMAQGCVLLIVYTMFALFVSLGVGFTFGAGCGFLTASAFALLSMLKYRRSLRRSASRKEAE